MPFRARGKEVQKKKDGKWVHHQTCKSIAAAKRIVRYLNYKYHSGKID